MKKINITREAEIKGFIFYQSFLEDWETVTGDGMAATFEGDGQLDGEPVIVRWKPYENHEYIELMEDMADWEKFWVFNELGLMGTQEDFELN